MYVYICSTKFVNQIPIYFTLINVTSILDIPTLNTYHENIYFYECVGLLCYVFSCDSSSICDSVRLSVGRSVILQRVSTIVQKFKIEQRFI